MDQCLSQRRVAARGVKGGTKTRRKYKSQHTFLGQWLLSLVSTATLTRDIDIAIPSVCLSVCPSVTFRYCNEKAQYIVILSSAYGSPIILVSPVLNIYGGVEYL